MIAQFAMSLGLLTLSGWLIDRHRREWSEAQADSTATPRLQKFSRAKHRRRMLASSTIGVVGGLIAIDPLIPRTPTWMGVYLVLLVLCFLNILLQGIVDAVAGARLYREVRTEQRAKQARMAWQLRNARSQDSTDEASNDT